MKKMLSVVLVSLYKFYEKKVFVKELFCIEEKFGLNFSGLWEMNLIYCHCSKKVKNLNKLKKSLTYVIFLSFPAPITYFLIFYKREQVAIRCVINEFRCPSCLEGDVSVMKYF